MSVKSRVRTQAIAWTLNNYTEEDIQNLKDYIKNECDYGCFSQETGESGTNHLQGYHHYANQRSYPNKAFRSVCNNRVHDDVAHGTPTQNRNYCSGLCEKKGNTLNSTFWEHGEVPQQGSRTDWALALEQVKNGSVAEAIETQPHLIPCISALQRFKQISQRSTHRNVNVIVLVGDTGTGKSRSAWEAYPELYSKPAGQWWDGYNGEKVVLLDDYDGEIELSTLLKWLDRYPVQLPVKGGFTPAVYETVVITSNYTPEHWYCESKHLKALKRRFTTYLVGKSIYTVEDILGHNPNADQDLQEENVQEERTSKACVS